MSDPEAWQPPRAIGACLGLYEACPRVYLHEGMGGGGGGVSLPREKSLGECQAEQPGSEQNLTGQ